MADLIPPSVDCTFPVESEHHTAQVLLVSLYSNELGGNPIVPMAEGGNPLISMIHGSIFLVPIAQGGSSPIPTTTPPSSMVTSFYSSQLARYFLHPYVLFQIIVHAYIVVVHSIIIDEGASVSIFS